MMPRHFDYYRLSRVSSKPIQIQIQLKANNKSFQTMKPNVQGGLDKSCVNTMEKPNLDKMFKGSKLIKTVVKTIKQIHIGFYKILKIFYYGLRIDVTAVCL